jgi:hypothetical protein
MPGACKFSMCNWQARLNKWLEKNKLDHCQASKNFLDKKNWRFFGATVTPPVSQANRRVGFFNFFTGIGLGGW